MSKRVEKTKPKQVRRSFTDEFKREAVALLLDGHSASSVAERLGLLITPGEDERQRAASRVTRS